LALQVATCLLDEFIAGVFFVDLAPIRDPTLVASTIAHALGLREDAGQPLLEGLKEYLGDRSQCLLLLDNFEQLLSAAPLVAELLAAAPGLKVLITSRAVLHLRGEKAFPVSPLAAPDPKHLPPVEELSHYAAVTLFLQRALDVQPEFAATNENAHAVAQICCRLDGLPLAIELAAARIRLLSPQALLARLQNPLKWLVGGARDLPIKQQTLRGTIAWSYDLLAEEEQALFRRLSVFAGGCTLEAAEAVCRVDSRPEGDLFQGLASLVDKSLLRPEASGDGEPRFTMLETLRDYARERLMESGEAQAIRRAHARYFLGLAEKAEPKLRSAELLAWLSGGRDFSQTGGGAGLVLEASLSLERGARVARHRVGAGEEGSPRPQRSDRAGQGAQRSRVARQSPV
jgi:predicted ATPase